ncbi:kynurenine/alpha-aminoadipate aminotransferase, mitochondrial-like [Ruditapes philippinarum]|uniref:kynurenine/alpha-aminoadipate aminotransferase, mitochondrial-like n=1 Tax=Ruditapes philippinarum TaxID=129788 RepID=UPI00295BDEE4|nr:kynurenine/alpha-aminoadipate aminotransferase, mitochondrial-like [Ruditapes philippinarum]
MLKTISKAAMDYTAFLSKTARARKPSALRELFDGIGVDETYVLMAGGLPNPEVFPITDMAITFGDGTVSKISQNNLMEGLQYGRTTGHPEILKFIKDITKRLHDPPRMGDSSHPGATEVLLTSGSNDGIYKSVEILLGEGDVVLTEEYVYPNLVAVTQPIGCDVKAIRMDKDGIIPECLAAELSKWPKPVDGKPSLGRLKALYCVPNGDNPTGVRYTNERKREIYRLAQEYNFIIIEDDAYFYLEEKPFNESFLSMDVDGRVIRLETFSKTIAPGLRLGFALAPKPFFNQLRYVSQASTQGSSNVSQMLVRELFRKWGVDGYIKHCEEVNDFYSKRRIVCERIARKHLNGMAEWESPTGGMFLWMKFKGVKDTLKLVMERLLKRKVLIVTGAAFSADVTRPTPYVRISYSKVSEEDMEKGFAIIAEELRALQNEQN